MNTFRNLEAYKEGKILVKMTYSLLKSFPKEEQYAICDQIRRAVVSVTSNIAEGSGRQSVKEKIHFVEISYGSLMEVLSQMDIACDLNYISVEEFLMFEAQCEKCARLLSGLRTFFNKSQLSNQTSLTPNP